MKTKEIEVWVDQGVLVHVPLEHYYSIATNQKNANEYEFPMFKARLIIEIQEQKIEITESQIEAAWKQYHFAAYNVGDFNAFKKTLGFTSGDE